MSGVPIIGKVFEDIEKGVKQVAGQVEAGVKHAAKEIDKDPILKAVVLAAAVYFTVGAAVNYFSATAATGAATAGATTQAGMLASQTAAFGAEGAALTTEALASNAAATGVVAAQTTQVAQAINASEVAGTAGTEITKNVVKDEVINKGAGSGIGGWINKNPPQAVLLGQAGFGAIQGQNTEEARKAAEQVRRGEEDRAREERLNQGLFGYDRNGKYAGNSSAGIVAGQMQQQPEQPMASSAPPAPIIASQQAAQVAPIVAPTVAVQRTNLPKIAQQRITG